ncbi:hypothetical protein C8R45DRAFT_23009 [Mycena sanguinolenta]|nr:hypothetical protein C8R45DRAFT_23009 [Mycena sanguinolenta]
MHRISVLVSHVLSLSSTFCDATTHTTFRGSNHSKSILLVDSLADFRAQTIQSRSYSLTRWRISGSSERDGDIDSTLGTGESIVRPVLINSTWIQSDSEISLIFSDDRRENGLFPLSLNYDNGLASSVNAGRSKELTVGMMAGDVAIPITTGSSVI